MQFSCDRVRLFQLWSILRCWYWSFWFWFRFHVRCCFRFSLDAVLSFIDYIDDLKSHRILLSLGLSHLCVRILLVLRKCCCELRDNLLFICKYIFCIFIIIISQSSLYNCLSITKYSVDITLPVCGCLSVCQCLYFYLSVRVRFRVCVCVCVSTLVSISHISYESHIDTSIKLYFILYLSFAFIGPSSKFSVPTVLSSGLFVCLLGFFFYSDFTSTFIRIEITKN